LPSYIDAPALTNLKARQGSPVPCEIYESFHESVVTKLLTDKELETKLLPLMRAGTLLIKKGSGVDKCPASSPSYLGE
jgi:hypothetical protein